jgi:hypothetical protein
MDIELQHYVLHLGICHPTVHALAGFYSVAFKRIIYGCLDRITKTICQAAPTISDIDVPAV